MWIAGKKPHNGIKNAQSEAERKPAQMYANLLFELSPSLFDQRFLDTDFGKLYQSIPFGRLAAQVPIPKGIVTGKGCKSWLTVEGVLLYLLPNIIYN